MSSFFSAPKIVAQTPTPPAQMPDMSDPAVLAARRKALADAASRDGRQATILGGNALGGTGGAAPAAAGDSYSATTLGGR